MADTSRLKNTVATKKKTGIQDMRHPQLNWEIAPRNDGVGRQLNDVVNPHMAPLRARQSSDGSTANQERPIHDVLHHEEDHGRKSCAKDVAHRHHPIDERDAEDAGLHDQDDVADTYLGIQRAA